MARTEALERSPFLPVGGARADIEQADFVERRGFVEIVQLKARSAVSQAAEGGLAVFGQLS